MATPFNGEEFYAKRSIFTSLIGLKFGKNSSSSTSKNTGYSTHQSNNTQYIPRDEPCSSRSILPQQQIVPPASIPSHQISSERSNFKDLYTLSAGDFPGRERSLSEQLAETLMIPSPETPQQQILSPQDIYKEIVCECAQYEQHGNNVHHHDHHQNQSNQQQHQQTCLQEQQQNCLQHQQNIYIQPDIQQQQTYYPDYYNHNETSLSYPSPVSPTSCPHCYHNVEPRKNILSEIGGKTTLEDLVKLVVAAVKDAGMIGKNDKKIESPEEILRRKRQQNNEAAARYRKRQREAKMIADSELEILTERNIELKEQLSTLQDEINKTKEELSKQRLLQIDNQINNISL